MGDQTQAYDIFQTPLSSGYPLPLSDGDIEQHGLFSNTPECDAPLQSACVAGSTVIQQHLWLILGMICIKIPVSFLFRDMTRAAKQAEFRRNSGPLRLVSSSAK